MLVFFSVLHVLLCIFMIFVILLQPGKDAGMGAALGGGAATTAFGGRGAVTFLGKVTAVSAMAFFLTSLGLSFVGLKTSVGASLAEKAAAAAKTEAPKTDAAKADAPMNQAPTPAPGVEQAKPSDMNPAPTPAAEPTTAPVGPQ
jgi:preprotein translocase subunit SecG